MTGDVLAGSRWECAPADPGAPDDPTAFDVFASTLAGLAWIDAEVPGTAAGALRAAGAWQWGEADTHLLDTRDWWFRCRFDSPGEGPWLLHLRGLATVADVWLNGTHLLHSDNMHLEHECEVDGLAAENELCIRFAALNPVLAGRRPRPRWKSRLLRHQNLRWIRTTLLGRIEGWSAWAAAIGPWRPVELVPRERVRVVSSMVDAQCAGASGSVSVRAALAVTGDRPASVRVRVGDTTADLELSGTGAELVAEGTVQLAAVERWWPHSHGAQPRYPVTLEVDDTTIELTTVGFRTVDVDRRDDGFTFVVNDVPVFCRGAIWVPPDVVTMAPPVADVRASLEMMRATGMNIVRIGGYGTYESPEFWDLCDELGILVWQDCMLASYDPPDDPDWVTALEIELAQAFGRLQGRPALALICGSSETYQQAAMFGLEPGSWVSDVLEKTIPTVAEATLPGIPYIASSPIGGDLPFEPSKGVAHYFGVGAYQRPFSDARLANVRFAGECLAFGNPPERATVDEVYGGTTSAGHAARWKAAVSRDTGTSWDFEDVRDFYVHYLYGHDPYAVRYVDSDYYLDLGRAAVSEVMTAVMSEWRRPGSPCAGGIVLSWQDLWPGAGWGLVDSLGRAKAPAYALRRVLDPLALLVTDEGLSGVHMHVINDRPEAFAGRLELSVYADDGLRVEHADEAIEVPAHGAQTVPATELLGGFRDLTRAYRFGPPAHDVVRATLVSADGTERDAFYLPLGSARPRRSDLGLSATLVPMGDGEWTLTVATEQFAQWVSLDVPKCTVSDSWFHLAPGGSRTVLIRADDAARTPRGEVRALNGASPVSLVVRDA